MFTNPDVDDFKAYFFRDFPYTADGDYTGVTDADIQKGLDNAGMMINPGIISTQAKYTLLYLLLSAHLMVMELKTSSQGVAGSYSFLDSGKAAGSVSESIAIPQRILDNPELSMLCRTGYGAEYLFYLLPLLSGQIFTVHGMTKP